MGNLRYCWVLFSLFLLQPLFSSLRLISPTVFFDHEMLVYKVNMLGPQVGFQTIFFDGQTNKDGQVFQVGRGSTISTPFFKMMYPVEDREITFFSINDFLPVYYERWVSEGSWKDHWHFFFNEGENFQYQMQSRQNHLETVKITQPLYNYVTLIQILRNVDAAWYADRHKTFVLHYLFGEKIIEARFSVSRVQIDIDWKKHNFFEMKEEKGMGLIFRYSDDAVRVPYQLVLPAYTVAGFKSINIVATLDSRTFKD